jgi:hypothetical protein
MTTILIKKKDTAGAPAPGDLTNAAGGTEIAVNTATRRIYTKDAGGNVVELGNNATSSTIADLTVTNSTTLSYGTANQVQYLNASKLLVGSANLTFNGTTLTANTIGAFTLGGTIAGGGNQINNVIIGTSTPLAGSFTTLTASTSITNSGLTAGRVTYAGTAGLLQDSANLTFDGTNLGLGGTTNTYGSQTTLTLSGSNVSRIDFRSNSVFTGTILSYQSITEGLRFSTVAGYPITFYPAGAEAGRFTAAGNLLIATTSATSAPAPSGGYLLEVAKNQNAFTEVLVKNQDLNSAGQANYTAISDVVVTRFGSAGSGDAYQTPASGFISVDSAYPLTFRVNASERARINSNGSFLLNFTGGTYNDPGFNGVQGIALRSTTDSLSVISASSTTPFYSYKFGAGTLFAFAYAASVGNPGVGIGEIATDGTDITFQTVGARSLIFGTNSTARGRFDTGANFLVGISSAMNGIGSDGKIGLQLSGSVGNFVVQNSADNNFYLAKINGYTNSTFMVFSVNGTNVGNITTNGTSLQLDKISGITFPATQVPSGGANTLDDYEEGTWSPNIAFGGASVGVTYDASYNRGWYTRVGRLVTCTMALEVTNKGSSTGDLVIGGFPFSSTLGDASVSHCVTSNNITVTSGPLSAYGTLFSGVLSVVRQVSGSPQAAITNSDCGSSFSILGTIVYLV